MRNRSAGTGGSGCVACNDLFHDTAWFQNEFQKMFGRNVFGNGTRWPSGGPAMNVWADDHAVFAEVDLPGIDPSKLDISVTDGNKLTIQAERPILDTETAVWHRQERGHGVLSRSVTLPTMVDADKVEAKYKNGVLHLTLPKAEAAKPRKIVVKS